MRIGLVRVAIDSGSGGIQGPLLDNGEFEYIPIPDQYRGRGVNSRTYGNTLGRSGKALIEYFPRAWQKRLKDQPIHDDPEFDTFTYGDPTPPKRGLRHLERGDLLIFYSGLEKWPGGGEPGLYIIGYFEVLVAGLAEELGRNKISKHFARNFHVRHEEVFRRQSHELVLVKGGPGSRLLTKAKLISATGEDRTGRPLKVLSPEMQTVFGNFGGHISIQRSPTRWVHESFFKRATDFLRSLK